MNKRAKKQVTKNLTQSSLTLEPKSNAKRKTYHKPILEKHSDIHLWAFGTMGG